ncbi:hypothetical protein A5630_05730 [Mycolicibacterium mucogenicum]|uniref:Uncharacterized protein n=1 Tax=Mycolicibacterium mucogenicum TaxID=56689 RepID=A0A1A3GNP3_MYCMU|nr:hypothetical protein A5630_05730 [Mycolicibacterium mucogenicum]
MPVVWAHHMAACPRMIHQIPAAPTTIAVSARSGAGISDTDADTIAMIGASARCSRLMPLPRAVKAISSSTTEPTDKLPSALCESRCRAHTPTTSSAAPVNPAAKPVSGGGTAAAVGMGSVGGSPLLKPGMVMLLMP